MSRWTVEKAVFKVVSIFTLALVCFGVVVSPAFSKELRVLSTRPQPELMEVITEKVIPAFEERYGMSVSFDFATWDERIDKLLISIAAGVPYDIVFTGFYSPLEEGSYRLITPLDEYLDKWEGYNLYPPGLWETQKWNGRIYSVPLEVQIRGIGYNKELFAQSGLDTERPPQSWEEMIDYSRMLTRTLDNVTLTQRGLHFGTAAAGGTAQNYFWWMRQAGITEMNMETYQSNLSHPKALEALEHLVDLHEAGKLTHSGVSGGIGGGRIAMVTAFTPASFVNAIEANPGLLGSVGVFAPRYSPQTDPVAHTFANGLAITEASRNKDEAWAFITEMLNDEALLDIQLAMNWISGRVDLTLELAEHLPGVDEFLGLFPYLYGSMLPPTRDVSQQEVARYLKQVFDGVISPQEALIQSHEIWMRLIAEWREQVGL